VGAACAAPDVFGRAVLNLWLKVTPMRGLRPAFISLEGFSALVFGAGVRVVREACATEHQYCSIKPTRAYVSPEVSPRTKKFMIA